MTIIEPNKNIKKKQSNLMLVGSIAALLGVALWTIVVYNQTVTLGHKFSEAKNQLQELTSRNAELKNNSYQVMDTKSLHGVAREFGLVKVENPEYLETDL